MKIQFTVPAVPVAQPRARATAINGQARMYEAKKAHPIHAFKASVREAAFRVYQGAPLAVPLRLTLLFLMPRPSEMVWKRKPMPRSPSTNARHGDVDNLAKGVMDAMNELLWADDRYVTELIVWKVLAAGDEQPRVEVTVEVPNAVPSVTP